MTDVAPHATRRRSWLAAMLRIAFRLLYHEMAWTYEAVAWLVSLGRWRSWRETALEFLPPAGLVLELGSGSGVLALEIARRGWPVVALDRSPQMIRSAHRRFRRAAARATFARAPWLVRADVARLPFKRGSFAAGVSTFPTEYILAPQVIEDAARVLRPGGRFIIVPSAVFTGTRFPARWARRLFDVTGQVPAWVAPLIGTMAECGLQPAAHEIQVDDSRVSVVIGTRPE